MTALKGYKCRYCGQVQTRHKEATCGDVFFCDDGKVAVFKKVLSNPKRPSQSFSEGEVGLLADIFDSLHVEDAIASRRFARHPDMANVVRKIGTMKVKLQ